eukprot:sb/3462615/
MTKAVQGGPAAQFLLLFLQIWPDQGDIKITSCITWCLVKGMSLNIESLVQFPVEPSIFRFSSLFNSCSELIIQNTNHSLLNRRACVCVDHQKEISKLLPLSGIAPSMSLWRSLVQFPVEPSIFRFSSLFNSCSELIIQNTNHSLLNRRACVCVDHQKEISKLLPLSGIAPSMSLWRSLVQFPVEPSIFRFSSLFNSCSELIIQNTNHSLLNRRACVCVDHQKEISKLLPLRACLSGDPWFNSRSNPVFFDFLPYLILALNSLFRITPHSLLNRRACVCVDHQKEISKLLPLRACLSGGPWFNSRSNPVFFDFLPYLILAQISFFRITNQSLLNRRACVCVDHQKEISKLLPLSGIAPSMSLWRSLVQFPVKPSIFRFSSLFNSCSELIIQNFSSARVCVRFPIKLLYRGRVCVLITRRRYQNYFLYHMLRACLSGGPWFNSRSNPVFFDFLPYLILALNSLFRITPHSLLNRRACVCVDHQKEISKLLPLRACLSGGPWFNSRSNPVFFDFLPYLILALNSLFRITNPSLLNRRACVCVDHQKEISKLLPLRACLSGGPWFNSRSNPVFFDFLPYLILAQISLFRITNQSLLNRRACVCVDHQKEISKLLPLRACLSGGPWFNSRSNPVFFDFLPYSILALNSLFRLFVYISSYFDLSLIFSIFLRILCRLEILSVPRFFSSRQKILKKMLKINNKSK